ncbi:MAG TPA: DUF2190 family protein [Methyloceanibacter sp.]|nr:DUF2190 family protein [Methyloceanibacter sp.]
MKNFVQPGDTITVIAPAGGLLSGDGAMIGDIFGVASYDAIATAEVELVTEGVFTLPKSAGVIAEGAQVWWDDSGKAISNVTGVGFFPIGVCVGGAADADPTCKVRLDGVAVIAA